MEDRGLPRVRGWWCAVLAGLAFGSGGCVFSIGGGSSTPVEVIRDPDEPLEQSGSAALIGADTGAIKVYYPVPYASPPNLTLDGFIAGEIVELVEQHADHFVLRRKPGLLGGPDSIEWTAVGVRASYATPPPVVIPQPDPVPATRVTFEGDS